MQPLIEPSDNVIEAFYAMPRLSGPRQFMRLTGKVHHHRRPVHVFQGTKHLLTAAARRCAVIHIAEDEHHRRIDIFDVRNRRPLDVILRDRRTGVP